MFTSGNIIVGGVVGVAVGYGIAVFVTADFNWLDGLWGWSRGDRAMFLYAASTCFALGALAASYPRQTH